VYDLGDTVTLAYLNYSAAGALANATAMAATVTLPDLTTASASVTTSTTGTYSAAYTPTQAGRHLIRWVGTGSNPSAYTDIFDVFPADPRFLISLADARDVLNFAATNTTHDDELRLYLAAATVVVEELDRPYVQETQTFTCDGGRAAVVLPEAPITAVTSVTNEGTALASTAYRLNAGSGIVHYLNGTFPVGTQNIVFTYTTGLARIPANVILAARELVKHWYQRSQQSPRPQFQGVINDGDMTYVAGYAVPNFVVGILRPQVGVF